MKPAQRFGASILAFVAVIVLALYFWPRENETDLTLVHAHVGNLKVPYFEHPEVQRIFREKYGLEIEVEGMATTEMLCPEDSGDMHDADILFAGELSQIAIYEECQGRRDPFRTIFLSPMVIYSWDATIDALVQAGVASQDANGAYHIDMLALTELIDTKTTWADLGLPDRVGPVKVYPTDPSRSSSGRSFAALLANSMNCVEVVDSSTVNSILLSIYEYYQLVGYLEPSSEALFGSYMTKGEGARPLVALIESQLADYLIANPDKAQVVSDKVRMLYPIPTVWTSHPIIARTDLGERVMEAMLDPELQALGWEITGFRPGVPGVDVDVAGAPVQGILPEIVAVIDMPGDEVMAQITSAASGTNPGPGDPRRDCSGVVPEASPAAAVVIAMLPEGGAAP